MSTTSEHDRPQGLLTASEAAQYLKIGLTTLNQKRRAGEIPWIRFMGDARYRISDLDDFIERHATWGFFKPEGLE